MNIEQAAYELEVAKDAERLANRARLDAEEKLLALIGDLPTEGTTRRDAGDYQVTVTSSVNRKVDQAKLQTIASQIPEAFAARLFRWKAEVNTGELRFIQNNEPELYAVVATAIEAKPAKPSVKVEQVKQREAA